MSDKKSILNILQKRVLILDGAMGTELYRRGMPEGVCLESWVLKNPEVLQSIHADYQQAGSDIIYASTFGANRIKLKEYGITKVKETNRNLVILAKKALNNKALIAGDIGSTGRFVQPFGDLKFEEAEDVFKEQVRGLLEGGVDLLVIETMMDIQEARAALIAVKELTDKFVMVTMTYDKNSRTLNGTDPRTAVITLQSLGADALGCNCSTGPQEMLKLIKLMKPYARVPLVAKPNAGLPKLISGETVFEMSPEKFSRYSQRLVAAGANIIGGCCGTTPAHIAELKRKVKGLKPILPLRKSISALSSARRSVVIEKNSFFIIGEKINPSGKKPMQKELLANKFSLIREAALSQQKDGATFLDVNVGVANINEKIAMQGALKVLATATELPLVFDSSSPETIEQALKIYPGRALINSLSAEKEKLKKLLPIARKFGAMFILLPLGDKGIPRDLSGRKKIIYQIFSEAQKLGFTKEDIVVDGLAMSMASNPEYAGTTLATIEWAAKYFKCNTLIGLSNVSFGLPNRQFVNTAFLALAKKKGLNLVIADPAVSKLTQKNAVKGFRDCASLVNYFSKFKPQDMVKKSKKVLSIESQISRAVLDGDKEGIEKIVRLALSKRINAYKLIEKIIIPGIIKVGDLFDKKEYFLPQLIASAETVKKAFGLLKPYIKKEVGLNKRNKNLILMATVKGDVHDIGKNIVSLILESNGFKVVDLGKDVSATRIISSAKNYHPQVVGLSALMTTTMVRMKEVIRLAQKEGLKCKFVVGGAVVNAPYARSIGAEYAKDATAAVRILKVILNK